ncbi:sodium/hydrogen exchanger [Hysterangium stoloniferum]|nr:sodium/hydrogen exchanger [Hysterangium stoloniferum]
MSTSTIGATEPPGPTGIPAPTIEEHYSSWSLFIVCILLIISLWTSYYLQIKRIRVVHETIISIFAGMAVGLVVRLAPGTLIREMLTFKHTLFFNLLLPPIILNSGYELKQENFFRNFGSILTFAFVGTFISAVGLGVLVYIWSFLGLESLKLSLLECLIFGSTLSATDPVTILAIFTQYKVDPNLYSVIFGESILNDAVSIVMYDTLSQFHGEEIFVSSLFRGIGIFLLSFSTSMALGVFFGLLVSLTLKHSHLSFYPSIESCLVALTAYTSYFFSNGLQMSGIVSLLFCGITLKHYAYHTMSRRTQRTTKYIFSMLAQLSENFIFIYLGLSIFTTPPRENNLTTYIKPLFIGITVVSVVFTRYASVFPLAEAINFFHRHVRGQRQDELPHSYQMMLFWAGLRGAVGVALAAGFQGPNAEILRTTVLVVVIATVILFGGTTARMLEVLGVRTGVEDDEMSESDEGEAELRRRSLRHSREWGTQTYGYTDDPHPAAPHATPAGPIFSAPSSSASDSDIGEVLPMSSPVHTRAGSQSPFPPPQHHGRTSNEHEHEHSAADSRWFQALDERYFLPLFSNATASRTFHARRRRGDIEEEDLEEGDDLGAGAGVERRLGEDGGLGHGNGYGQERRPSLRGLGSPGLRGTGVGSGSAGRG